MWPGEREGMGEGTETVIPGEEAIMLEIFSGEGHGENICGGGCSEITKYTFLMNLHTLFRGSIWQ